MNATTPPFTRSRVLEPSAGTRRWLALLLGVEGLAALAAAVTSISLAPDAAALIPTFGATGQVALLLLAGAGAVMSIMPSRHPPPSCGDTTVRPMGRPVSS